MLLEMQMDKKTKEWRRTEIQERYCFISVTLTYETKPVGVILYATDKCNYLSD